jgi:hypothetical protein
MEAKNHNITWLQTTSQTEIMPQYQSLDTRERGKLRLELAPSLRIVLNGNGDDLVGWGHFKPLVENLVGAGDP